MSWLKLDDQIAFHQKTMRAGNEAFGAWVRMAAWCCAQLTDGYVPGELAISLCGGEAVLNRLLDAKLLDPVDGGYVVHDFLVWNPSADEVKAKRGAAKERMLSNRNRHRDDRGKFAPQAPQKSEPHVEPSATPPDARSPNVRANESRTDSERSREQSRNNHGTCPLPVPVPLSSSTTSARACGSALADEILAELCIHSVFARVAIPDVADALALSAHNFKRGKAEARRCILEAASKLGPTAKVTGELPQEQLVKRLVNFFQYGSPEADCGAKDAPGTRDALRPTENPFKYREGSGGAS